MYQRAKWLSRLKLGPVLLLSSLAATSVWAADAQTWRHPNEFNMAPGVTDNARHIFGLHMMAFWICVAIAVVVFGVMIYTLFRFRKSRGAVAATFHESTTLEIAWTVVPFLILIGMAIPATHTLIKIYDNTDPDLSIMITGYQWKWKYEYIIPNGENFSFFSNLKTPQAQILGEEPKDKNYLLEVDHPLVIPVDKKVRFLVTGNDVIHSWWVPEFGIKRDAIPGFVNEASARPTRIGTYRGQCAELCGTNHGFMPIVVKVVAQNDYNKWVAGKEAEVSHLKALMAKQWTLQELVAKGKQVYDSTCMACHGDQGQGGVGKPIAHSPVATGPIREHLLTVIHGRPGTAMQAFGNQLSDVDLAAVVTYERNAFGNNMGDMAQPVDVYNLKKGQ